MLIIVVTSTMVTPAMVTPTVGALINAVRYAVHSPPCVVSSRGYNAFYAVMQLILVSLLHLRFKNFSLKFKHLRFKYFSLKFNHLRFNSIISVINLRCREQNCTIFLHYI